MKKILAILLSLVLVLGLAACGGEKAPETTAPPATQPVAGGDTTPAPVDPMAELIAAAQAEGTLVVYGSCEEEYLAVACEKFENCTASKCSISVCPPVRFRARAKKRERQPLR